MTVQFIAATIIRGVGIAGLATLLGSAVLEVLVLPREPSEVDLARRRLRRVGVICLVALVATTAGELVTRAQTMAGGSLAAAIPALMPVLTRTHFGAIWIGRLVLLAFGLLVSPMSWPAARVAALFVDLALAITTSLTGHAADWGDLTPSAAIDWVHVVSASAWTGGLLCLALCVLGPARRWPLPLLGGVMRRFSRIAGLCLPAVIVTGSYNAWLQLARVSALWTTPYGRVLAVKLVLVLGLAWWGAVNRYTVVARLGTHHALGVAERFCRLAQLAVLGPARVARRALPSRLSAYVGREAVLAVLVFGCTAVLVDSTPARHAGHAGHLAAREPGPFRLTEEQMEELHESGGVPEGWIFVPPAGNAAHGRQVFIRVGCYACHRIEGEKLPPPSGPGPDLTGMSEHHPAGYILESILNPNAVILEGPGYTTADGKSIMPDFRGELSVNDLVDLVAYLKTV